MPSLADPRRSRSARTRAGGPTVALLAAIALLGACSSSSKHVASNAGSTGSSQPAATKDAKLVFGVTGNPASLDPVKVGGDGIGGFDQDAAVFDTLLRLDASGQTGP